MSSFMLQKLMLAGTANWKWDVRHQTLFVKQYCVIQHCLYRMSLHSRSDNNQLQK